MVEREAVADDGAAVVTGHREALVAERAVRPAVLWRKGSFGSDSEAGSRFAGQLLTMIASCRPQGRRLLDFLLAAGEATLRGRRPPSLIPALQGG
jgi:transposase